MAGPSHATHFKGLIELENPRLFIGAEGLKRKLVKVKQFSARGDRLRSDGYVQAGEKLTRGKFVELYVTLDVDEVDVDDVCKMNAVTSKVVCRTCRTGSSVWSPDAEPVASRTTFQ